MPVDLSLVEAVDSVLGGVDPIIRHQGGFDAAAWKALCEYGFDLVSIPEEYGGSGGGWSELAGVLDAVGARAASVPIASHVGAARAVAAAKQQLPDGLLTIVAAANIAGDRVTGVAPFGRHSDHFVHIDLDGNGDPVLRLLGREDVDLVERENPAGEPTDAVGWSRSAGTEFPLEARVARSLDLAEPAAIRAILTAGALRSVQSRTIKYAGDRVQFGRPLSRFQAVQSLLVTVARGTESTRALVNRLVSSLDAAEAAIDELPLIAAARVVGARAGFEASRSSHQVHGAMGVTAEHPLYAYTSRLLAWRDCDGSELYWATWLGRYVRESGPENLWSAITATSAHTDSAGVVV